MKKPVIIGVSALTLLAVSATLFAQTTTGSSLITEMKAGVRAFTLTADLNPGATGLQSAPLVGKRTGDQLSAAEYNRLLELVGQGGAGNSELITSVFTDVTAGGVQKTYTCPDDMKVLSAKEVLVPSGISVCGIPIQADGKSVKYGGCNPSAGINWHATVVCGKVIGSGGTGGGAGWVDVGLTGTENFDVACDYRMRSAGEPTGWTHAWIVRESYVAFNVSTADASLIALIPKEEKGFWDYHRNGNLATKVQEDVLAVTHLQKLCAGGGGTGGVPIVKQISGSTPPQGSNYIALCNGNTTVPTMTGYGPLPVYWNSTTQKWIGRRIEIPTAGSGANVSGYMFDCPSLWIAE